MGKIGIINTNGWLICLKDYMRYFIRDLRDYGKSPAEMERKYPNEWLFIIEPEISENTELLGGIVSVHSSVRDDIYDALDGFIGGAAVHYTGKMPEGKLFLL